MKHIVRIALLFINLVIIFLVVNADSTFVSYGIQVSGPVGSGLYVNVTGTGGTDGRIDFSSCNSAYNNCVNFTSNDASFPPPVNVVNQLMYMGTTSPNTTYRVFTGSDPGTWTSTIYCRTNAANNACVPGIGPGCGNYFLEATEECEIGSPNCTATCEIDTDGDTIPNNRDNCPNQGNVNGTGVNANGCPNPPVVGDRDVDGVPDNVDACPDEGNTNGTGVDASGCPNPPANADRDHDGVPDSVDDCPDLGNINGTGVYADGCPQPPRDDGSGGTTPIPEPIDSDRDGIPDDQDACPYQGDINGTGIDSRGCPNPPPAGDSDGDGISDSDDGCPYVYGIASNAGCPIQLPNEGCYVATNTEQIGGQGVFLHESSSESSPTAGRFLRSDEIVEVSDIDGDQLWYQIELSGDTGWVSRSVIRVSEGCNDANLGAEIFDVEYLNQTCPENVDAFFSYPVYIQSTIATASDPCEAIQALNQIAFSPTMVTILSEMPNLNHFADCTEQLPVFISFVENLIQLRDSIDSTNSSELAENLNMIINEINAILAEDACAIGTIIADKQIPGTIGEDMLPDVSIAICTSNITPARFEALQYRLSQLGISARILASGDGCGIVQTINILGELSDELIDIFELQVSCGISYVDSLNVLLGVVITGANLDGLEWSDVPCSSLTETLVNRIDGELPEGIPENLDVCSALLINLFYEAHVQDLYLLDQLHGLPAGTYFERIVNSADPCEAIRIFINTGHVPESPASPPHITPIIPAPNILVPTTPLIMINSQVQNPTVVQQQQFFVPSANGGTLPSQTLQSEVERTIIPEELTEENVLILLGRETQNSQQTAIYTLQDTELQYQRLEHNCELDNYVVSDAIQFVMPQNIFVACVMQNIAGASNKLQIVNITNGRQFLADTNELEIDYTAGIDFVSASTLNQNHDRLIFGLRNTTSGNTDLYAWEITTENLHLVVENAQRPAVSWLGELVAFERLEENGARNIYIVNTVNGVVDSHPLNMRVPSPFNTECFSPAFENSAVFSVYFVCTDGTEYRIYVAIIDTLQQTNIVNHDGIIQNLDASRVPGLVTFDDGGNVYYAFVDVANDNVIDPMMLPSLENVEFFGLDWTYNR